MCGNRNGGRALWLTLALFLFAGQVHPQDRSFILEADNVYPYTPAYLGNGAISLVTTPLGTEAGRTFLAGVYDHTAGDVPRIASAPAWNEVDLNNGISWLNAHAGSAHIEHYRQQLNMYDGVLRTEYVWAQTDKLMQVSVEQFVARDQPQLAGVSVTIRPQFSGPIVVRLSLNNWPASHRYDLERLGKVDSEAAKDPWKIWYPGRLDVKGVVVTDASQAVLSMDATAPGTSVETGQSVALEWPSQAQSKTRRSPEGAEVELHLDTHSGNSYTFRKFMALVVSPRPADVREQATRQAEAARKTGWEQLRSRSSEAWHTLWQTDVVVEGDSQLQRTIHSMLFYLLCSTREDLGISTGPMGLSSAGYYGHIFWDADTFMFPGILVLHPELARPMVAFRSRTRGVANENAQRNGFHGAMYPWEAGPDGVECTPKFAFQNATSENHVNGDVALAAWEYWLATGDRNWLANDAWPILRDTADFWISRVSFDPKRRQYVIGNVVAVNESEVGVSNDPYTNAIAKKNLELAQAAARTLHTEAHPKWRDVAEKMYLPGSGSALLWYPLDGSYPRDRTRQAIDAMLSRIQDHRSGAMMGTEFYPILAAEVSDRAAIGRLLLPLCLPYLRPPFQAIAETPGNQNVNFITGAGAFLQQFVFGYTGLRFGTNGLERKYPPTLPPGITRLTLKSVCIRGQRQTLTFASR